MVTLGREEEPEKKGLQVFPRGKFSTMFLFLSFFTVHILLLRCIVIDLWMVYALFFIVDCSSFASVYDWKLI